MIVAANKRISELQLDMAMLQTALNTYATALKPLLDAIPSAKDSTESDAATYTSVLRVDASST